MQLSKDFVKKIEIQYLHLVLDFIRAKKISVAIAKSSAQLILTYLPFKDSEDMKHKLSNFKEIFPTFVPLYNYFLDELEKENTQDVLAKMRHLMKNEDIDSALKLTEDKK
ncbi:hypothetical protein BH09PAT2_BH09PAT2_10720 [soil metagenome]